MGGGNELLQKLPQADFPLMEMELRALAFWKGS